MKEPVRLYLYGLLIPTAAILVAYGILSNTDAPLWIALAEAALGVGAVELARSRVTPTRGRSVNVIGGGDYEP